ncbi:MAG: hypothetical protein QNJ42_25805 [Crocosphaera sp.]|nr:hypothetical protein [Crocosphaera sp.]
MVCIDNVIVCNINSFSSSVQQLGLKLIVNDSSLPNPLRSESCLTTICLESTSAGLLSALTPVIINLAFMIMLWLILHLFYSLIPGEL